VVAGREPFNKCSDHAALQKGDKMEGIKFNPKHKLILATGQLPSKSRIEDENFFKRVKLLNLPIHEIEIESRKKYSLLNFIDDVIHGLKCLLFMSLFVYGSVLLWAVYNPQVKKAILEIQNIIMEMISIPFAMGVVFYLIIHLAYGSAKDWIAEKRLQDHEEVQRRLNRPEDELR